MWLAAALAAALAVAGCSGTRARRAAFAGADGRARVALLPLQNLSGAQLPTHDVMLAIERAIARAGLEVVSGDAVDEFLARRRIRYTGGVDGETAKAAAEELEVDAVVVTSIGLFWAESPPKLGITMRLVSAADPPVILWTDSAARAGDESPGLLELGLTNEMRELEKEVVAKLGRSLARALDGANGEEFCDGGRRWAPLIAFRSSVLREPREYSVAILPFVNQTARRGAGEAVALEFVRQLSAVDGLHVMDPGVVRRVAVGIRIVQEDGVSLEHARLLTDILGADLIVSGTVRDYDDRTPLVDFTALVIHREGRQVVWESTSRSRGDDAVTLFGAGAVRTTMGLTCRMVRSVVEKMVGDDRRRRRASPLSASESESKSKYGSGAAFGAAQLPPNSVASAQLLRPSGSPAEKNGCNHEGLTQ